MQCNVNNIVICPTFLGSLSGCRVGNFQYINTGHAGSNRHWYTILAQKLHGASWSLANCFCKFSIMSLGLTLLAHITNYACLNVLSDRFCVDTIVTYVLLGLCIIVIQLVNFARCQRWFIPCLFFFSSLSTSLWTNVKLLGPDVLQSPPPVFWFHEVWLAYACNTRVYL